MLAAAKTTGGEAVSGAAAASAPQNTLRVRTTAAIAKPNTRELSSRRRVVSIGPVQLALFVNSMPLAFKPNKSGLGKANRKWPPRLRPWRGGAGKPVVDRLAQPFVRDRRDCDAGGLSRVKLTQKNEEICRCLREIPVRRKVNHIFILSKNPAEIEARLALLACCRLKSKFCARRVMGLRHPRRTNWAYACGLPKRLAKHRFDVRPRDPAWPQQSRVLFKACDDRRTPGQPGSARHRGSGRFRRQNPAPRERR